MHDPTHTASIMTYSRALLVCAQGIAYQLASTPPNKTPPKARYDAAHPWYIRIAPTVMKIQQPLIWLCAFAELAIILTHPIAASLPSCISHFAPQVFTAKATQVYTTPTTLLGVSFVIIGSILRLTCFRALGQLFTFDLTILPKHTLVTSGLYAYVRHPAYTGSLAMILGLALVNLTSGSWVTESGLLGRGSVGAFLRGLGGAAWWIWWLAVGFKRCRSEDAELRKTFGKEWDDYAARVQYWFVPWVI